MPNVYLPFPSIMYICLFVKNLKLNQQVPKKPSKQQKKVRLHRSTIASFVTIPDITLNRHVKLSLATVSHSRHISLVPIYRLTRGQAVLCVPDSQSILSGNTFLRLILYYIYNHLLYCIIYTITCKRIDNQTHGEYRALIDNSFLSLI